MSRIGIVTDSSADLPLSFYKSKQDVVMLPLNVRLGWESLMDWYDISPEFSSKERRYTINEFYQEMAKCVVVPHTDPVNAYRFEQAYKGLAQNCEAIVSIHFSHNLGYTVKAAQIAASRIQNCKVVVIDTLQISNGYGAIVKELIKRRDEGLSLDTLVEFINSMIKNLNSKLILTNSTCKYLYRCKRMNLFVYVLAKLIRLQNFTMTDGKIRPVFKYRGSRGFQMLLQQAINEVKNARSIGKDAYLVVSHANNESLANKIIDRIKREKLDCEIRYLGPITGVYGGAGSCAVLPVIIEQ